MPCLAAVSPLSCRRASALAVDRVRHVGDPVAFIVADSADDRPRGRRAVDVDYEALPAVVDGRAGARRGRAAALAQAPRNTAFHIQKGDAAAVGAAMKQAAHIVEIDVMNNRVVVAPIEHAPASRATMRHRDASTSS
jgi:carbon-monoxide dehydrogenase large subunit